MLNLDSCMVEILLLFSLLCGIPLCNCGGQVATLKLRCPSNFALGVKGSVTVPKRNSCLWISFCNSNMGRGFYAPGYIWDTPASTPWELFSKRISLIRQNLEMFLTSVTSTHYTWMTTKSRWTGSFPLNLFAFSFIWGSHGIIILGNLIREHVIQ